MEDNEKLFELLEYLKGLELEENDYSDDENIEEQDDLITTFRNAVMTIHRLTEIRLDYLLTYHLSGKWYPSLGEKAQKNLKKKMAIFNHMEFYNKVKSAEEAGFFSGGEANKILYINNIRNWFSHPSAYAEKTEQYRNPEKITNDLETIIDIYLDLRSRT